MMMMDEPQIEPKDNHTSSQLHCTLSVILSEWLSEETVTTLVAGKMEIVSMCCLDRRLLGDQTRRSALRVEAFGSGEVILQCFKFDPSTTRTTDLVNAVQQQLQGQTHKNVVVHMLLLGDVELDVRTPQGTLSLLSDFGIADNASVSVVVHDMVQVVEQSTQYESTLIV